MANGVTNGGCHGNSKALLPSYIQDQRAKRHEMQMRDFTHTGLQRAHNWCKTAIMFSKVLSSITRRSIFISFSFLHYFPNALSFTVIYLLRLPRFVLLLQTKAVHSKASKFFLQTVLLQK